jgi:hypothetical protein
MGRWRSGARLVLAPEKDDPGVAGDPQRNVTQRSIRMAMPSVHRSGVRIRETRPLTCRGAGWGGCRCPSGDVGRAACAGREGVLVYLLSLWLRYR